MDRQAEEERPLSPDASDTGQGHDAQAAQRPGIIGRMSESHGKHPGVVLRRRSVRRDLGSPDHFLWSQGPFVS